MGQHHLLGLKDLIFTIHRDVAFWTLLIRTHPKLFYLMAPFIHIPLLYLEIIWVHQCVNLQICSSVKSVLIFTKDISMIIQITSIRLSFVPTTSTEKLCHTSSRLIN